MKSAGKDILIPEFKLRLLNKYGIDLDETVCSILLDELSEMIRDLLASGSYDKIPLKNLGSFYLRKKPSRKLHVNLPNLKQELKVLPERFELRFHPIAILHDIVSKY